ncbi:MAG TPA: uroporphyrinogen-III C-methyltransferase [Caldimonas sp.]|nr:uroporphyrinogen-III C-methyltransferase [Caldimonas sp.]HEX2541094.1 uroporphyrinogen-III C-methyltransferase [Caldimonas sp.]
MNDAPPPAAATGDIAFTPAPARPAAGRSAAVRWGILTVLLLALVAITALVFAWRAEQRVRSSERELVRRHQESSQLVTEANLLARQAQESARDAVAKATLLEARLNEVSLQRSQLEELIQSVARSRDDNLVADIEADLRAAMQQAALTGSAEPLVAALKQGEERLLRANQPRLEPVRRAIARDLERAKATSVADVATLSIKLDEAVRMIDELPLLSELAPRRDAARMRATESAASAPQAAASSAQAASEPTGVWLPRELDRLGRLIADSIWSEARALIRITRIDQPEAMLVAPDQAFFLRENLKLRLLNARLALLARQNDSAQSDLRWVAGAIERYFDRSSKRTQNATELLRQVSTQARQAGVLRADDTFAALAAAGGSRTTR